MISVILVDDEKVIVEGLSLMISRYVKECTVIGQAYNGLDGYKMGLKLNPDIFITDIRMPLVDGLEMIKKLKEQNSKAIFIILSGYSEFEYAKKAIQSGVNSYINKPVEEEELVDALKKAISEVESKRQLLENTEKLKKMAEGKVGGEKGSLLNDMLNLPQKKNLINEVQDYIANHYNESISLDELSKNFYVNPHYLSQLFKEKAGETYLSYLTKLRINMAKELLMKTDLKVYEICEKVGYVDVNHFGKQFERLIGLKPSEFRKQKGS